MDPTELRAVFNRERYWERAKGGELTSVLMKDRHPSLSKAKEPFCTKSQMVSYRDGAGNEVVRVHQYLRPDGTLGASGRPDPKLLLMNGVLYRPGEEAETFGGASRGDQEG